MDYNLNWHKTHKMLCKNSIASIYHGKLINLVLIWEQTQMKLTKNKMLWYIKTIFFLVKHLNVVAECCLNWPFFHGALYCCVRYSNIECQDEIFKTYHKKYCSKGNGWNLVLEINFMTLNILKLDFFPHNPWVLHILEGIITNICRKTWIPCNFIIFKTKV